MGNNICCQPSQVHAQTLHPQPTRPKVPVDNSSRVREQVQKLLNSYYELQSLWKQVLDCEQRSRLHQIDKMLKHDVYFPMKHLRIKHVTAFQEMLAVIKDDKMNAEHEVTAILKVVCSKIEQIEIAAGDFKDFPPLALENLFDMIDHPDKVRQSEDEGVSAADKFEDRSAGPRRSIGGSSAAFPGMPPVGFKSSFASANNQMRSVNIGDEAFGESPQKIQTIPHHYERIFSRMHSPDEKGSSYSGVDSDIGERVQTEGASSSPAKFENRAKSLASNLKHLLNNQEILEQAAKLHSQITDLQMKVNNLKRNISGQILSTSNLVSCIDSKAGPNKKNKEGDADEDVESEDDLEASMLLEVQSLESQRLDSTRTTNMGVIPTSKRIDCPMMRKFILTKFDRVTQIIEGLLDEARETEGICKEFVGGRINEGGDNIKVIPSLFNALMADSTFYADLHLVFREQDRIMHTEVDLPVQANIKKIQGLKQVLDELKKALEILPTEVENHQASSFVDKVKKMDAQLVDSERRAFIIEISHLKSTGIAKDIKGQVHDADLGRVLNEIINRKQLKEIENKYSWSQRGLACLRSELEDRLEEGGDSILDEDTIGKDLKWVMDTAGANKAKWKDEKEKLESLTNVLHSKQVGLCPNQDQLHILQISEIRDLVKEAGKIGSALETLMIYFSKQEDRIISLKEHYAVDSSASEEDKLSEIDHELLNMYTSTNLQKVALLPVGRDLDYKDTYLKLMNTYKDFFLKLRSSQDRGIISMDIQNVKVKSGQQQSMRSSNAVSSEAAVVEAKREEILARGKYRGVTTKLQLVNQLIQNMEKTEVSLFAVHNSIPIERMKSFLSRFDLSSIISDLQQEIQRLDKVKIHILQNVSDLKRLLQEKRELAEDAIEQLNLNLFTFENESECMETMDDKCQRTEETVEEQQRAISMADQLLAQLQRLQNDVQFNQGKKLTDSFKSKLLSISWIGTFIDSQDDFLDLRDQLSNLMHLWIEIQLVSYKLEMATPELKKMMKQEKKIKVMQMNKEEDEESSSDEEILNPSNQAYKVVQYLKKAVEKYCKIDGGDKMNELVLGKVSQVKKISLHEYMIYGNKFSIKQPPVLTIGDHTKINSVVLKSGVSTFYLKEFLQMIIVKAQAEIKPRLNQTMNNPGSDSFFSLEQELIGTNFNQRQRLSMPNQSLLANKTGGPIVPKLNLNPQLKVGQARHNTSMTLKPSQTLSRGRFSLGASGNSRSKPPSEDGSEERRKNSSPLTKKLSLPLSAKKANSILLPAAGSQSRLVLHQAKIDGGGAQFGNSIGLGSRQSFGSNSQGQSSKSKSSGLKHLQGTRGVTNLLGAQTSLASTISKARSKDSLESGAKPSGGISSLISGSKMTGLGSGLLSKSQTMKVTSKSETGLPKGLSLRMKERAKQQQIVGNKEEECGRVSERSSENLSNTMKTKLYDQGGDSDKDNKKVNESGVLFPELNQEDFLNLEEVPETMDYELVEPKREVIKSKFTSTINLDKLNSSRATGRGGMTERQRMMQSLRVGLNQSVMVHSARRDSLFNK